MERLLLRFCHEPDASFEEGRTYGSVEAARAELADQFGEELLRKAVAGRNVLDFGCGMGYHAAALLEYGAASVTGVDIQPRCIRTARALLKDEPRATIVDALAEPEWSKDVGFDVILSLNSFEHMEDPAAWMRRWAGWLSPGGRVLVAFGPLWWSPYGAHMSYFVTLPWVHVLFPERAIMSVRKRYRTDGAERYEDVPGGLNRMSLRKFHACVRGAGLWAERIRYFPVRGLPGVTRVPGLNEFLTQGLSAVLIEPNR